MATRRSAAQEDNRLAQTINGVFMHEDAFSEDECRRIREMVANLKLDGSLKEAGMIDSHGKDLMTDYRQSSSCFVYPNEETLWIFQRLRDVIAPMNNAVYRFALDGFEEGIQLSEYPVGNGYGWHVDLGANRASRRKLSMTLQLSSPDEYEGGELEFMDPAETAGRKIGTLCVFPSFVLHRVRPITRGTRWSMVSWICGAPFR
jgi:PKHD-type hydroxylase